MYFATFGRQELCVALVHLEPVKLLLEPLLAPVDPVVRDGPKAKVGLQGVEGAVNVVKSVDGFSKRKTYQANYNEVLNAFILD